ncbi:MAG TPA: DUF84 family protein [Pseudogracilibacillus sp.]|nr:DUF84 family protein [Pseudogracilibacillus sp.]
MNIVIGSTNPTKIKAVKAVFPEANVHTASAPSDISAQPIGDNETLLGAMNRAKYLREIYPEMYGVGLEGGVMYVENNLFLNSWGVLITQNEQVYTAAGARIPLPDEFSEKLNQRIELSTLMDDFTNKENVRNREGAIGIFTSSYLTRADLFAQVMTILKGQMEYDIGNN